MIKLIKKACPPAGVFTKEELIEVGIPPERIAEMDPKTELFMQWIGCPQGSSAAVSAFNIHMQGYLT